ncbi:hypothetical protein [Pelobacter propionicus]|uniref:Uncharacterized protein n=1 Tax=Pelobacter propionicus (strain DSM 2379 / NBRC 103807 / OttBd1) TaxID=338966 RepID=A1AR31_PELPD|nr:hypothetical protein [Pelobacter propionicus]ABK99801.1 hypothetical protein Ppro_2194 [Pelobacter propionicus DSM 2379]
MNDAVVEFFVSGTMSARFMLEYFRKIAGYSAGSSLQGPTAVCSTTILLCTSRYDSARKNIMTPLTGRLRYFKTVYRGWLIAVLGGAYALLGVITFARDNLLPPALRARLDTFTLLPHWSLTSWLVIALGIFLVGALEGSYRYYLVQEQSYGNLEQQIASLQQEIRDHDQAAASSFHDDFIADNRTRQAPIIHIKELRAHFDALLALARTGDRAALARLRRIAPKLDAVSLECFASSLDHVEDIRRIKELVRLGAEVARPG